jgi:purine-nucleoside phosphorylase
MHKPMNDVLDLVKEFMPETGLVLGSGLGMFVERLEVLRRVSFAEAGLPQSRVSGHAGELVLGRLGNARLAVLSGRVHLYEGRKAQEVCAGVRLLAEAGVRRLLLTNAAGTLHTGFPPGQWMMLTDHINLTGQSPLRGGPNFVDMSEVYSRPLREQFASAAARRGMPLHEGVYIGVCGPQYETPAEIRAFRALGADAVGMSTVLEAIQARALGLEVAAFSCLTNWAAGLAGPLDHSEVIVAGREAAGEFAGLLEEVLRQAVMPVQ